MLKKWSAFPLVCSLALFVILIFVIFYWLNPSTTVQAVSKDEVKSTIEQRYNGQVENIQETDKVFVLNVKMADGIYEITVDASNGQVQSLSLIEKQNSIAQNSEAEKESILQENEIKAIIHSKSDGNIESVVLNNENSNQPEYHVKLKETDRQITFIIDAKSGDIINQHSQAIEQPIKKISEEEAISIAKSYKNAPVKNVSLESNGKNSYYLVALDTSDDAIIQVHSITGEIISVSTTKKENQKSQVNDDDDDDDDE